MPEITLITAFAIVLLVFKLKTKVYQFSLSARIAMSVMLLLTAGAHIGFAKGMAMMLPGFVPFKTELVYITGLFEFLAAIGLLIPKYQVITAWCLIAFFILILPANIYACIKHVDIENATFNGDGPGYLWFRIPLQLFFIGWIYLSTIYKSSLSSRH